MIMKGSTHVRMRSILKPYWSRCLGIEVRADTSSPATNYNGILHLQSFQPRVRRILRYLAPQRWNRTLRSNAAPLIEVIYRGYHVPFLNPGCWWFLVDEGLEGELLGFIEALVEVLDKGLVAEQDLLVILQFSLKLSNHVQLLLFLHL